MEYFEEKTTTNIIMMLWLIVNIGISYPLLLSSSFFLSPSITGLSRSLPLDSGDDRWLDVGDDLWLDIGDDILQDNGDFHWLGIGDFCWSEESGYPKYVIYPSLSSCSFTSIKPEDKKHSCRITYIHCNIYCNC